VADINAVSKVVAAGGSGTPCGPVEKQGWKNSPTLQLNLYCLQKKITFSDLNFILKKVFFFA
jgi:hypothetical protein